MKLLRLAQKVGEKKMNYIIVLFMMGMCFLFTILSFISKDSSKQMFRLGSAFLFIITGVIILSNGIEVPVGTLTELVR